MCYFRALCVCIYSVRSPSSYSVAYVLWSKITYKRTPRHPPPRIAHVTYVTRPKTMGKKTPTFTVATTIRRRIRPRIRRPFMRVERPNVPGAFHVVGEVSSRRARASTCTTRSRNDDRYVSCAFFVRCVYVPPRTSFGRTSSAGVRVRSPWPTTRISTGRFDERKRPDTP